MESTWRDLRMAVRSVLTSPLTSGAIILTLALGIGANTALYTIVRAVLFEPLPYPAADRLVYIWESNPQAGYPRFAASPLNYRDFRDQSSTLEAAGAASTVGMHLTATDRPERLFGLAVTAEFFDVFALPSLHGRILSKQDDQPGAPNTVVLNHAFWERRFGADPAVVGTTLPLNGEPYEVIGVMPQDFYPLPRDFFVPARLDYQKADRGFHYLVIFARLREGVSLAEAETDLDRIAGRLSVDLPESNKGWDTSVTGYRETLQQGSGGALRMLLLATFLVLGIAVANAASLFLARLATRQREVALRAALGATVPRLVRRFLSESILLTLIAAVLGLVLGTVARRLLLSMEAVDLPSWGVVGLDRGVLLYALGLSLGVGLLFGVLPALRVALRPISLGLQGGGARGSTLGGRRLFRLLIAAQVAFALVVLVQAALLLRSFASLAAVDSGYQSQGVLTSTIELPPERYPGEEAIRSFYRRLSDQLSSLGGVDRAAMAHGVPLTPLQQGWEIVIEGEEAPEQPPMARFVYASPGYFEALGIPLLQGRAMTPGDDDRSHLIAVVNERAARLYWGDESPIGRRVAVLDSQGENWMEVVGVVGSVMMDDLTSDQPPVIHVPLLQSPQRSASLVLQSNGDPAELAGRVAEKVASLDPLLPLFDVSTMEQLERRSSARPRFNAFLLSMFAALALVLNVLGIYGVVSYAVRGRIREIGIRQALGAAPSRIRRTVLVETMVPVLAGLIAGGVACWLGRGLIASQLYGVVALDPVSWALSSATLLMIGLLASWLPARRASLVSPFELLSQE